MTEEKFKLITRYVATLIPQYSIKDLVAEVYNLYQDYLINEAQEEKLYRMVDPEEEENNPAELWYNGYGCTPLWSFVERRV